MSDADTPINPQNAPQPMAKLFALWMAPAPVWAEYGLDAPAGSGNRAYIDVVPHDLDPAVLRELAPRIPFEVLDEYLFMGNATEVFERLESYADAGLEHPVMMNMTGLLGGVGEAMARTGELAVLGQLVHAAGKPAPIRVGT